jgi:hypothetical protein
VGWLGWDERREMTSDPRLVTKGRRQTVPALLQQSRYLIERATQYEVELAGAGWSPADTTALGQALRSLERELG